MLKKSALLIPTVIINVLLACVKLRAVQSNGSWNLSRSGIENFL